MNKDEAMARIEAIEHEAAELRRIIEAPEQTWKPEDLVGKLCYVWNGTKRQPNETIGIITNFENTGSITPWRTQTSWYQHAEPVSAAEVEKMIYRKSRYDWSKAPEWAQWASTDFDGRIDVWENKPSINSFCNLWNCVHGNSEKIGSVMTCHDWRDSLERRQ